MRTTAAAFAWEFGRRHRWGWMAVAAYLVVLAAIRIAIPQPRLEFESEVNFAFAVIVPLSAMFFYFLAVFTFGLSGDVAARESMYPARMFTLPVTTDALVAWPMLYGCAAMALLWLATRTLALWPAGVPVPMFWPALLGPVLLAWTQAFTWMPYPFQGMRVIVVVLWMTGINAIVMTALELKAPEHVMVAILAPQLPFAYLVARFAVARARQGGLGVRRQGRRFAIATPKRWRSHRSPKHAQLWLEWRQHGRSLPWLVAIVLPFELALLFPFRDVPVIVFEVFALALLTPPFLAIFVAATVGKTHSTFLATRPLTNDALIAAKLRATIRSTLVAWLLVVIAVPIALQWSGAMEHVIEFERGIVSIVGLPRAIALALLVVFALVASTWKQLVQSLCIGMSGREWLVKASVFVPLALLTIAFPFLLSRGAVSTLFHAMDWILAALVVLKLCAAGWVARRFDESRLLVIGAAIWTAAVFVLYAVLRWTLPELIFPSYILALIAILAVPLARLSAAPLALAWSRHG